MNVTLSGKTYDVLKWTALILLPALAILYSSMAPLWGFPYVEKIVGTISAIDVFLGVLLGISSIQFQKNPNIMEMSPAAVPGSDVYWIMSDKAYEVTKWIAQVVLPGLAAFYFALAVIWTLPEPEKVVTTIMAIDTFLGLIVGFSTAQFNKTTVFAEL